MSNEQLISQTTRHTVYVQRFAGFLSNQFNPFAEQMRKDIAVAIISAGQIITAKQTSDLIREIREIQLDAYEQYNGILTDEFREFSINEAEFELKSLDNVIESNAIVLDLPADNQVWAAVKANPLVFTDTNDVVILNTYMKGIEAKEIKRISDIIRTGIVTGQTTEQIVSSISGKGGAIDSTVKNNIRTMVRTSTNHVSNIARLKTMSDNDDIVIGYELVVTFDGRTSQICRSYGQADKVYKPTDKFRPVPPFHPNCRTSMVAVLDERYRIDNSDATKASKGDEGGQQIAADETYYSWLKKQSKAFQDDALGPTRGQLMRNGGLTSKQFGALNVDQLFRPLNLKEMKAKNPLAFEKAGL